MTALPVAGPRLPGLPPQAQASLPPQSNPGSSQPPQGVLREIPPAILCKIGQETVQDIVSRSMEIFHLMWATQLPNGVTQSHAVYQMQLPNGVTQSHAVYQDRFHKLQEHLRQLALLFRKLRLLYEKCAETTAELGETPSELRSSQLGGSPTHWKLSVCFIGPAKHAL
ncbi:Mediator of RNA polymerase II transcription subunit 30 [Acipenser ruthenus]|uniref:Mediator of RNA polymerase II transcription subunit 30 n=1 Tax=Acipenser ruthenus TaxID=7906 RepID=A0A662YLS9_ACIRT|nr:Mediator of RNA polymerase II transcription subunit 30 [Acipenser ruthenus]